MQENNQKKENIINNQWNFDEWKKMVKNLRKLDVEQLRKLTTRVGIKFEGGNITVQDTEKATAKEQFILVLDEVPKNILIQEYKNVK